MRLRGLPAGLERLTLASLIPLTSLLYEGRVIFHCTIGDVGLYPRVIKPATGARVACLRLSRTRTARL